MDFWTKPKLNLLNIFSTNSTEEIEDYISEQLFPGTYPVIFSSARVGIKCILNTLGISRGSNVLIPRFGSHCLWNSIGSIANPTSVESEKISAVVSYKKEYSQYASKHKQFEGEIIYDSVDTFFLMNCNILEDGENYKIISLPKIIGSIAGGVVFCKTLEQKKSLLAIRKNQQKGYIVPLFRGLAFFIPKVYKHWSYLEPSGGRLIWFFRSNIYQSLKKYSTYQESRLSIINFLDIPFENSIDGYLSIYFKDLNLQEKYCDTLFFLSCRTIFDFKNNDYKKCWIYPIHHDSNQSNYIQIKALLKEEGVRCI